MLRFIPFSMNADVRTSLHVEFTALQTWCRDLSHAAPDNAGNVHVLALQGLHALQESGQIKMRDVALEASWAELLAKAEAIVSQYCELLDENRWLEHQLVTVTVEKKRREARDVESLKAVIDAKVELPSTKEAFRVHETQAFVDRSQCVAPCRNVTARKTSSQQVGKAPSGERGICCCV